MIGSHYVLARMRVLVEWWRYALLTGLEAQGGCGLTRCQI